MTIHVDMILYLSLYYLVNDLVPLTNLHIKFLAPLLGILILYLSFIFYHLLLIFLAPFQSFIFPYFLYLF